MAFPLWYLLIPYALVIVFTSVFIFFNVFHLARYGVANASTKAIVGVYVIGYLTILALSLTVLLAVDWTKAVPFSDLLPFSLPSTSIKGL